MNNKSSKTAICLLGVIQKMNSIDLKKMLKNGDITTPQRLAVLDIIVKHDGEHLSPEEIYDLEKKPSQK